MIQFNPANERIKRQYFGYLRDADGLADVSIDHAARAICAFEQFTKAKDLHQLSPKDATAWRQHLLRGRGRIATELSSRATVRSKLLLMKKFVVWLSQQAGFRSKIAAADAAYFDLPRRDRRLVNERRNESAPSLDQLRHIISLMPSKTDRQLRDRALLAFLLLTGARVTATTSFKLKHVSADRLGINQDARTVRTKGGRSFVTAFFPVGNDIRQMFLEWFDHLRLKLHYGPDDPLFPTCDVFASVRGEDSKLNPKHWTGPDPIRAICRSAFERAGIPYHPPHTIRRTLAVLGEELCKTGEEMKAWSQNLGHLEVLTTMLSYGALSDRHQLVVMNRLSSDRPTDLLDEMELFLRKRGFTSQGTQRDGDKP